MKKNFNIALLLVIAVALTVTMFGCMSFGNNYDVVVLFTNDVHCGIEDNIGYAGLAAYKKELLNFTRNVTLVDCGDAIQGDLVGTVSKGEFPVEIMNYVGYDFAVLGNHEFDYGMDRIQYLMEESKATYLGCNIKYTGDKENKLEQVLPFKVVDYHCFSVAYIGVSTPESLVKSNPSNFKEDGETVYDFFGGDPEEFYANVQNYIDIVKNEYRASRVVVLSHLGDEEGSAPYRSIDLIEHTSGIDFLLDGHAHSVIPCRVVTDKDGNDVKMASTGTKLRYIGQLTFNRSGISTLGIISDYPQKDAETTAFINEIKASYEKEVNKVVATSDTALSSTDANGVRMVRNRETALGNFCADAYRAISGADIAIVNGGGIRSDLKKGDITYADVISIHPFGNTLCMVKTTGAQILDALELACRNTTGSYSDGVNALGESGGFLQVSGLKFEIDTSVPSSVKLSATDAFVEVTGERRVKNVKVLCNGEYVDIDPDKTYTLASHNFLIKNGGDGYTMFQKDELLIDEGMIDNQVLITYLTDVLGGKLGKYSSVEGRIIVK